MKASDLQIGDYIQVSGETFRVISISHFDIDLSDNKKDFYHELIDNLQPIPLTPEILEKNGFELKSDGWLWCEDKDVETQNYSFVQFRRDREVRIVEINFLNKAVAKFRNVQYVHELQHALRLCGINKEIKI